MIQSNDSSKPKLNISAQLQDLEQILTWFEKQKDADVEEGIKKVRQGAELIERLRAQLKAVQNEFEEIKKSLEEEE